jgi:hypothetical protein
MHKIIYIFLNHVYWIKMHYRFRVRHLPNVPILKICRPLHDKLIKVRQQDILSKHADEKIRDIIKNSGNRLSQILVPREEVYSDKGDVINLPGDRKIVIGDSLLEPKRLNELSLLIMSSELKHIFSSPGERKIGIDDTRLLDVEEILGERTVGILNRLRQECARICSRHWSVLEGHGSPALALKEAGVILSWLSPQSGTNNVSIINGTAYSYTDPHCDKANNFEYDVGFLLYLNSSFKGGDFCFMDLDCDRFVQPKAGRFLSFTSSIENIHRVAPVLTGNRLLLSIWYSLLKS